MFNNLLKYFLLPLVCALISSVVAVFVSNNQIMNFQINQSKINTLNKVFGHRYVLYDDACFTHEAYRVFTSGLGEAAVIFGDSPEVLTALESLRTEIVSENFSEGDLSKLYMEMMKNIGITTSDYIMLKAPIRRTNCKVDN